MMNARLAGRLERYHQAKVKAAKRAGRMREAAMKEYTRRVSPGLTVRFDYTDYDVSAILGVAPGDMLIIDYPLPRKRSTVYAKKYDERSGRWMRFLILPAQRRVRP